MSNYIVCVNGVYGGRDDYGCDLSIEECEEESVYEYLFNMLKSDDEDLSDEEVEGMLINDDEFGWDCVGKDDEKISSVDEVSLVSYWIVKDLKDLVVWMK